MATPQNPPPPPPLASAISTHANTTAGPSTRRVVIGLSVPQWMALVAVIASGGTAYATLAPKSYVDAKTDKVDAALVKLAESHAQTSKDVAVLAGEMRIVKRLVVAGAAREEAHHHAEMAAVRAPRNARSRAPVAPTARPAAKLAQDLGVDPLAPLDGL